MNHRKAILMFLLMVLAACQRQTASMPERSAWTGTVALTDGPEVPLRMELDLSSPQPTGSFVVGDEKTPIPEIVRNGNALTFSFSEYRAEIRADWDGRQLSGNYVRIRADGNTTLKFTAMPEGATNKPQAASTTDKPALAGNYQVSFQGESKDETVAKFWTKDGAVFGTFIAPDGDYGLLQGKPSGQGFQFSRFTGWQATAIVLQPSGENWSGTFYAASESKPRPFVLSPRGDTAAEPAAVTRTKMKKPESEFTFACAAPSGEMVTNTDDRFKGKALLIDIMGTWCHNCLDEAPVLQGLQEKFGKDGFEVVGLSFEITDDAAVARKNLQLYKDRFGLTYPLLFCGILDDKNVDKQINSQLSDFFAYPTSIFADKKHRVQSIHSGFKGPGTGDEFQGQVREFEETVSKLVK